MDDVLDAAMMMRHSVRYPLIALLACLALVAQNPPEAEEEQAAPPAFEEALPITTPVYIDGGQKDLRLEIVVHRWSDGGEQDEGGQRFTVSIKEQPAFMENVRWEEGPEIEFAPGEHSKTLPLLFDTAHSGATGQTTEEAELVLLIEARHEAVVPPERELEIPLLFTRALQPGSPAVFVCALKEDAPEELPIEEAFSYCDPERKPVLRSDRIVVFFTPARDLSEPIQEDQYFYMRILGPNGDELMSRPFWNKGTAENPDISMPFTTGGAPGRLAVPLHLWRIYEDPQSGGTGPGTYTLQTVEARIEGNALFGQGEGTPFLASHDWRDEGTFEIGGFHPVFAGFVAETVDPMPLPRGAPPGVLTIGKPQVSGASVSIDMSARWQKRENEPEHRVANRLSLKFPEKLMPDYSGVGEYEIKFERLEQTEDDSLFFTAGVHKLVTTNIKPPDRHLVEGDAIPKLWEGLEQNTLVGCRGGSWLWEQGAGNPTARDEATEGQCNLELELTNNRRTTRFGDPERDLASHLHDEKTLWVIPVFYGLVDHRRPYSLSRRVNIRSYGYAIYAAEPYTGPGPRGRPDSGGVPGEEITETTPDPGGEESTTTTTVTGTGTGTGPGVTTQPPPPIDPSNPGGLDPDGQPAVGDLVREWLAIAEPPENAVPGNHFRYDEVDRLVGGGTEGRVIRTRPDVGYGSGPSPAARVWSDLRTKLDSIDHCLLEEYVVARLRDQGIGHCAGRYGAVQDLSGFPLDAARSEVSGAGFNSTVALGDAAPAEAFNGTVQHQEPPATQHLRRGEQVTLVVYTPAVASAILAPDVVDLPGAEARQRIQELGLYPSPEGGSPARFPGEEGAVESQRPDPQTPLQAGDTVTYRVRGPYVSTRTIPNVIEMTVADATAALTAAGIAPAGILSETGSAAPSAALAGRVQDQDPAPGWTIQTGTRVRLTLYGEFIDVRTVPSIPDPPAPPNPVINPNTGVRDTGRPPLRCPSSAMVVGPLGGETNPVSAGTWISLNDTLSGFKDLRSSVLHWSFECTYTVRGMNVTHVRASWVPPDATRTPFDFCGNDVDLPSIEELYSRTHRAKVEVFPRYLDRNAGLQTAREFLPIIEKYSMACGGTTNVNPPPPTPPPTPPPPPKPKPTRPPACPGPGVTHVYYLHIFGPYGGPPNPICRDSQGNHWINVSNNIHPVQSIELGPKDPNTPCWNGSTVRFGDQAPVGNLCGAGR